MGTHLHVLEYSRANVTDGVIRGVKIIGTKSRNGYTYPLGVLSDAMPLYEGAPVYMLHPDDRERRNGSRQLDAHLGSLSHIEQRPDGLYGDLAIRQSHPAAGLLLENLDKPFGLSHNAVCDMTDDKSEVTKIVRVNSVDLVDNPGTTTNLFEETEAMTLEEMNAALDERFEAFEGKMVALLESVQPKPEEKPEENPAKPTQRIQALEAVTDEEGDAPEPIGNTHEDFLGALRGFQTA